MALEPRMMYDGAAAATVGAVAHHHHHDGAPDHAHLLAAEKGRIGERYILGARNLTLKQILDKLAAITGFFNAIPAKLTRRSAAACWSGEAVMADLPPAASPKNAAARWLRSAHGPPRVLGD